MNEEKQIEAKPQPSHAAETKGWTSASNAEYDDLCHGRHLAQAGLPEESSSDSEFGRKVHDALAKGNPEGLDKDQLDIYETSVEITKALVEQVFGPDASKAKRWVEERFWCKVKQKFMHSGKPDLVLRFGSAALIIEYKALPGDVPTAATNMQVRDQVVLVSRTLAVNEAYAAVVQPLVSHTPTMVRYDATTITRAEQEMFQRVERSNDPNATRTAGERQCKFCVARHTCKQYKEMVALAAPAQAMHELALISVADWTPAQRAVFCDRLPLAIKWLEECKKQMKKLLSEQPDAVPGFALEAGSPRQPVRDCPELHGRFLAAGGSTEQFLTCVSVGKGEFEALVRAATKLKGKALKAKVDELYQGLLDSNPVEPSIIKVK